MKEKKRIVYFTKHTAAGQSSRYRSYAYQSYLRENGFVITTHPLFPSAYSSHIYGDGKKPVLIALYAYVRRLLQLIFIKKYDIVYIESELFPYLPFHLESWLLRRQKHIVIDYDEAAFYKYHNSKKDWIKKWCGDKIEKLSALADVVITGNSYVTNWMLPYAKKVIEIPTGVYLQTYLSTSPARLPDAEKNIFRIGWIGSVATSPAILLIRDCLLQLQELYHIKLVLIGFDKRLETELTGLPFINYKWEQNTEISLLKTCDIGVMPFPEETVVQDTTSFRMIQYMACGLPTIGTPTGAMIKMNHGSDNMFAKNKFEWYSCLTTFIQNKEWRKEVGKKNIDIAEKYYSAEKNQQEYLSLFKEIVSEEL